MKSILEDLYYDNPRLAKKINRGRDYTKLDYEYGKVFEQLLEELNKEQKKMLNELNELSSGLEAESGLAHFKEGFKLCMRLMLESMSN